MSTKFTVSSKFPEVLLVRLLTGEEIIATVYDEGGDSIALKDPVMLIQVPADPRSGTPVGGDPNKPQVRLALAPWMDYLNKEGSNNLIDVNKASVMFAHPLRPELTTRYKELTSGLALPDPSMKKIIVPGR